MVLAGSLGEVHCVGFVDVDDVLHACHLDRLPSEVMFEWEGIQSGAEDRTLRSGRLVGLVCHRTAKCGSSYVRPCLAFAP